MTRKPTTLEVLLLALIDRAGLNTVYRLRQEAGLNWGGIRPSLLRLEKWGLLTRSIAGGRRRREFALSETGKALLPRAWREALEPTADLDAVMRGAWIASQFDPDIAIGFASVAAEARTRQVDREAADRKRGQLGPLEDYRWMRSFVREHQLRAEAVLLQEFAAALAAEYGDKTNATRRNEGAQV